ncbi:hypothetical protein P4234_00130 [Pseudomonas aeruginosa]|nr:hypothetical protein [Pseudomonas aeruginosa]
MDQMQYRGACTTTGRGENPPYWRMQQPYVANGANYVGLLKGVCFDPILGHYRHGHCWIGSACPWPQPRWQAVQMDGKTYYVDMDRWGSGSCLSIRRGGQHERADAAGGAAGTGPARYLAAALWHWAEAAAPACGGRLVGAGQAIYQTLAVKVTREGRRPRRARSPRCIAGGRWSPRLQ